MIMQEYTHGYKYILVPALTGNFCSLPIDQLSYGTIKVSRLHIQVSFQKIHQYPALCDRIIFINLLTMDHFDSTTNSNISLSEFISNRYKLFDKKVCCDNNMRNNFCFV